MKFQSSKRTFGHLLKQQEWKGNQTLEPSLYSPRNMVKQEIPLPDITQIDAGEKQLKSTMWTGTIHFFAGQRFYDLLRPPNGRGS